MKIKRTFCNQPHPTRPYVECQKDKGHTDDHRALTYIQGVEIVLIWDNDIEHVIDCLLKC